MRYIYLDHNATTPVHPDVLEAMLPFQREAFGNPSSVHQFGRRARVAVDDARDAAAEVLGAPSSSVIFCSGGTEANNTIINGVAQARRQRGATWSRRRSSILQSWTPATPSNDRVMKSPTCRWTNTGSSICERCGTA